MILEAACGSGVYLIRRKALDGLVVDEKFALVVVETHEDLDQSSLA